MGLLSLRQFVVGQSIGYFFGGSPISVRVSTEPIFPFIVDLRINEALQTGAVGNRTYRAGESVYLFLEFTITAIRLDMRSEYCVDLHFVIWVTGFEPC